MKKSKVTAAEEARNEAMRETLRFILRRGDAKTRHALKKMLADAAANARHMTPRSKTASMPAVQKKRRTP